MFYFKRKIKAVAVWTTNLGFRRHKVKRRKSLVLKQNAVACVPIFTIISRFMVQSEIFLSRFIKYPLCIEKSSFFPPKHFIHAFLLYDEKSTLTNLSILQCCMYHFAGANTTILKIYKDGVGIQKYHLEIITCRRINHGHKYTLL